MSERLTRRELMRAAVAGLTTGVMAMRVEGAPASQTGAIGPYADDMLPAVVLCMLQCDVP